MSPYDPDYKNKLGISERINLGIAAEAAVKALAATRDFEVLSEAGKALRNLIEFINEQEPKVELTKQEADFCRAAHTYFRKYCDDPITTLLYVLIARNEGDGVWAAFVKAAVASGFDHWDALSGAQAYADQYKDNPKNVYMECALKAWPDKDFNQMVKTFREEEWCCMEAEVPTAKP